MYSSIPSKGGSTDAVHSGLARQVSSLLTNHLARATECCGNQAAGNDALQDVLSLLNDLSRYEAFALEYFFPVCQSPCRIFGGFFQTILKLTLNLSV